MLYLKKNRLNLILIFTLILAIAALSGLDASPGKDKKPPVGGGLPENPDIAFLHYGKTSELTLLDSTTGDEGALPTSGIIPGWSVDGNRLAYLSNAYIWIVNTDGSDAHQLLYTDYTVGLDWTRNPAPTGQEMIIYDAPDAYGINQVIYAVNSDGTGTVQLTDWEWIHDPKWSPDGTRFVAYYDDMFGTSPYPFINGGGLMIFSLDMVGGVLTVVDEEPITGIAPGFTTGVAMDPDWSNSGDWIVFEAASDIYIINTWDYMDVRRLTFTPDKEKLSPCFDATDSRIIFVMRDKNKRKLFSIDALDGSGLMQVTDTTSVLHPAARR